jgi:hypothetical protein
MVCATINVNFCDWVDNRPWHALTFNIDGRGDSWRPWSLHDEPVGVTMNTTMAVSLPVRDGGSATGSMAALAALRRECQGLVRRRAAVAGLAAFLPLPGVDLITDAALLLGVVADINRRFGLTDDQLAALSPARQAAAYQLITAGGNFLASRLSRSRLLLLLLRRAGLRFGVMEAVRFAPLVGQFVAALIAYLTLIRIANRHIDQCVAIASRLNASA